jgi:hypothetical protein
MKPIAKITATVAVTTIAAALSLPAVSAEGSRVTVIGVHNEQATAPIAKALGLADKSAGGGRFAMVQLKKGAFGNRSYAMVYVPRAFAVRKNDVVELTPGDLDLWSNPGKGVVIGSKPKIAAIR